MKGWELALWFYMLIASFLAKKSESLFQKERIALLKRANCSFKKSKALFCFFKE